MREYRGRGVTDLLVEVVDRLTRIEAAMAEIREGQTVIEFYTTEEFAKIVGKADFTVREYCRLGRIAGSKKGSERGKFQSWVVPHEKLLCYRRDGLLPIRTA